MATRIVPFFTVATEFDQTGENAIALELVDQTAGAKLIFNTTIGKTRIWNGTAFQNAPVLSPDGSAWQGSAQKVFLPSDVINNNATANTMADVTGLSFPVTAGVRYRFKFRILYDSAATTTGSRWSINGPATTLLRYRSHYSLTGTSRTFNEGLAAYNNPSSCNASSVLNGNVAVIEGIVTPSANGNIIARFASEVLSSAITAKVGSYVEYETL